MRLISESSLNARQRFYRPRAGAIQNPSINEPKTMSRISFPADVDRRLLYSPKTPT